MKIIGLLVGIAKAQPHHGGHVILYFNQQGQLLRRVDGQ